MGTCLTQNTNRGDCVRIPRQRGSVQCFDPIEIAKDFLRAHGAISPFTESEIDNLRLAGEDISVNTLHLTITLHEADRRGVVEPTARTVLRAGPRLSRSARFRVVCNSVTGAGEFGQHTGGSGSTVIWSLPDIDATRCALCSLSRQRENVSLSNVHVIKAILYVAEQGYTWRVN